MITDAGVAVGKVTDVVIDTGDGTVVGYEVEPAGCRPRNARRSYIPLPEAVAVSGEALVVPARRRRLRHERPRPASATPSTAIASTCTEASHERSRGLRSSGARPGDGHHRRHASTTSIVDPATKRAVGFRSAKGSSGDWLAWDRIAAIGPDAVTIDVRRPAGDLCGRPSCRGLKANGAIGGRVLTDQGREVGSLNDVDIDDDGAMVSLLVGDRRCRGRRPARHRQLRHRRP